MDAPHIDQDPIKLVVGLLIQGSSFADSFLVSFHLVILIRSDQVRVAEIRLGEVRLGEVRGSCNRRPKNAELNVLSRWAKDKGLEKAWLLI